VKYPECQKWLKDTRLANSFWRFVRINRFENPSLPAHSQILTTYEWRIIHFLTL